MRTDRELLQAALPALDWGDAPNSALIEEIRARLSEPENAPVAWLSIDGHVYRSYTVAKHSHHGQEPTPLYRRPPRPTGLDKLLERIRFLEQQIKKKQ